jgi:DNA polymerase V
MSQFALIDCNNFFVSCERLFRPELEGKPVVVLSSNDGCAVSRSAEAKALGIPMGAPAFKYKDLFRQQDVRSFSANFELYGDISQRLTALLTHVTPRIEIYSVDESFLDLSELDIADYDAWGRQLKRRIQHEIGIPVSVGIAPSKTLAKLANHRAKKEPRLRGSLAITDPSDPAMLEHYCKTPIADIWGIGWRLAPKLKAEGIHNAEDLRQMYPPRARQLMGKHGVQMIAELQGTSCLPLQMTESAHQTIMRGRTLGQEVNDEDALQAAIATLSARAAFCLRRDGQLVRTASLIMNTNKHKPGYRRIGDTVRFTTPTADTGTICRALTSVLGRVHNPRLGIYRVNVLFHELVPADSLKLDLFGEVEPDAHDRAQARMAAFDAINARYGKGHIKSAAEVLSDAWQPRRGSCSPRYTSRWSELPTARVGSTR